MSFLKYFEDFNPDQKLDGSDVFKVNNHLHTPFSFSAFEAPEEALDQAVEEDVKVVGCPLGRSHHWLFGSFLCARIRR